MKVVLPLPAIPTQTIATGGEAVVEPPVTPSAVLDVDAIFTQSIALNVKLLLKRWLAPFLMRNVQVTVTILEAALLLCAGRVMSKKLQALTTHSPHLHFRRELSITFTTRVFPSDHLD